jgi:hypothetical protein
LQVKQCVELERHFESHFQDSFDQINIAFAESVSSLRKAEISFVVLQKDAYYRIEKVEKKELHEHQDISIDRVAEYARQSSEIDHRAANKRFDEDARSAFNQSNERSQELQL